jgi:hypothetical protein
LPPKCGDQLQPWSVSSAFTLKIPVGDAEQQRWKYGKTVKAQGKARGGENVQGCLTSSARQANKTGSRVRGLAGKRATLPGRRRCRRGAWNKRARPSPSPRLVYFPPILRLQVQNRRYEWTQAKSCRKEGRCGRARERFCLEAGLFKVWEGAKAEERTKEYSAIPHAMDENCDGEVSALGVQNSPDEAEDS